MAHICKYCLCWDPQILPSVLTPRTRLHRYSLLVPLISSTHILTFFINFPQFKRIQFLSLTFPISSHVALQPPPFHTSPPWYPYILLIRSYSFISCIRQYVDTSSRALPWPMARHVELACFQHKTVNPCKGKGHTVQDSPLHPGTVPLYNSRYSISIFRMTKWLFLGLTLGTIMLRT